MKLSLTAILGLAGQERWREHARATAAWVTELSPEYFSLLTMFQRHNDDFLRSITLQTNGGIVNSYFLYPRVFWRVNKAITLKLAVLAAWSHRQGDDSYLFSRGDGRDTLVERGGTDGGRIHLFYKVGHKIPVWQTMVMTSDDGGVSWSTRPVPWSCAPSASVATC